MKILVVNDNCFISSVVIGGEKISLKKGITKIGNLLINVIFENRANGLYSWYYTLENTSDAPSPRIQNMLGCNYTFSLNGKAIMNTLGGDFCSVDSFREESFDLADGASVERAPCGARSSDRDAFPYFDIINEGGEGVVCGIGWSGQWKLNVSRVGDSVTIKAGFADCDFVLPAGEIVRSARILIYMGNGGVNSLRHSFVRLSRQFYSQKCHLPENFRMPMAAQCFDRYYWGNQPKEGEIPFFETEEAQLHIVENTAKCGLDTFWIDACWFDGAFRTGVGNYRYAKGFQNSLLPVSDSVHKNGMRFILWFEPVRALEGTDIMSRFGTDYTKIIRRENEKTGLVNLGDNEVWQYVYDSISRVIEENKIDMYRQDFNINPLDFLRLIENDGQKGLLQIHFVTGMYRLWDALRERFPGLFIDNCASGGRLMDVETNMRATTLWQSDMACRPCPSVMQNENLALSRYLPYHQGSCFDYAPYHMRSAMTSGISCEWGFLDDICSKEVSAKTLKCLTDGLEDGIDRSLKHEYGLDIEAAKRSFNDVKKLAEYWEMGDFTALAGPSNSEDIYVGYDLYIPKENKGAFVVFRRLNAPERFEVRLLNVDENAMYELISIDENLTETNSTVSGKELKNGYTVTIPEAPASETGYYRNINII